MSKTDTHRMKTAFRWTGAKKRILPLMLSFIDRIPHNIYTEPFCGTAIIATAKQPVRVTVLNDIDEDIYNLFSVLRTSPDDLRRAVALTPYSRQEYNGAQVDTNDPIERARRFLVRTTFSHSSKVTPNAGFDTRINGDRYMGRVGFWADWPDAIEHTIVRLTSTARHQVIIENLPALDVIRLYDAPDALVYCDPHYWREGTTKGYNHNMTREDHEALSEALHSSQGAVLISGYPSALYEQLYGEWTCHRNTTYTDGGKERTECLWLNERAQQTLQYKQTTLFS